MNTGTQSLWHGTHQLRRFGSLPGERTVDVLVVGGGITGLTAAVLMAREGRQVALIEQDRIGAGETGHTTSHLTEAIDGRYQNVREKFGEEPATLVAQSSRDAIDLIERFCAELPGDAGFARVPGYLYSERQSDVPWLARELDAAARAGCAVEWTDVTPVPFKTVGAIQWANQGQVHATAYLAMLVDEAERRGVRLFEETRATNVHDASGTTPCIVHTDRFDIRCHDVVVAAHVPVNNRVFLHTKIAAYRSYAMAMEVGTEPQRSPVPPGLFWDTDDPYHYTRIQETAGRTYLIVGGEDHRTGVESDTEESFARLLSYAETRYGTVPVPYRWSGQIIEPVDGLPFIGLNTGCQHVYVATGYSGNGMTFGTLAAMIVSDAILGRTSAYADLYAATRIKPLAAAYDYVSENALFPAHLVADRLSDHNVEDGSAASLQAGEGAILQSEGQGKVAVCRDRLGALHAVSAVCTHLGCDVAWNNAEQTWDCPCHGSRFSPEGRVINGPAVSDLSPIALQQVAGQKSQVESQKSKVKSQK